MFTIRNEQANSTLKAEAREFIRGEFVKFGLETEVQNFTVNNYTVSNSTFEDIFTFPFSTRFK